MNCVSDEKGLPVEADFPADNDDEFGIMIECRECGAFHDRSTGDVFEVLWNFEGGDPSITTKEVSVVVCYENPGKYDVTLLVKGENRQDVITRTEFVEVLPKEPEPLNASFSADTAEIVQNQMIMLMDESTGSPDSWSWVVEGPGPVQTSQDQNPSFMFEDPGVYSVSLTITRGEDQDTEEKVGFITVLAFSDFTCLVTDEESGNGFSTTFTYNNLDQLTRSDLIINGQSEGFNTYTWNDEGLLDLVENFDASQIKIGSEAYTYNDQGILSTKNFFDGLGKSFSKYNFTIEGGLITGGTKDKSDGLGGILTTGLEYLYDGENNNVIEERSFIIDNGHVVQKIAYEFDDKINLFLDVQVDQFPNRYFQNNPARTTFLDGSDDIIFERTSEYQYNQFGSANWEERKTIGDNLTIYTWEFECKKKP